MATHEHVVLNTFKDQNGDNHLLYPITKTDCIDGLEEFVEQAIVDAGTGGAGGSSVQADYTQNDETASDYIKNRPFYVGKPVMVEILPETQVPFFYNEEQGIYGIQTQPTSDQLSLWQSDWIHAEIVWDGTTYICEPQYVEGIKCIGNIDAMMGSGDNGMPFIIMMADAAIFGQDTSILYSLADTPVEPYPTITHDVSGSLVQAELVTLDPKFLGEVPWAKIAHKPFGEFAAGTVVVDDTVEIEDSSQISLSNVDADLCAVDVNYNVILGEYECSGIGTYDEQDDMTGIRISSSDGTDVADIFAVSNMAVLFIYDATYFPTGTSMDIKVTLAEPYTKKIDSKFLPESSSGSGSGGGSSLPEVTTEDNGKVLGVVDGVWTTTEVPTELPTITASDAGKFLRVSADGLWVAEAIPNAEGVTF